ncbi:diamine acetyltransferase 1-like [Antedon mediterranea]|uniref:diamine acetyltransferase 1-like n=1 Tax=Antedon mediterranea TaxID=105859 RepID=UPI003AF82D91
MEDGNFRIRDARPEDCAAIMKMILELAVFENSEDQVEYTTEGCQRMHWAVLGWNKPAINMYKTINSIDLTATEDWHMYTMFKPQLLTFVTNS